MSVLFPSVYTQSTLCISDTLDDRCFDVVLARSSVVVALSVHSLVCTLIQSFVYVQFPLGESNEMYDMYSRSSWLVATAAVVAVAACLFSLIPLLIHSWFVSLYTVHFNACRFEFEI